MSIYLGNLSAQEMCDRLGIECTEEIRAMENTRSQSAKIKRGDNMWHCFDIPFAVECGTRDIAMVWYNLLSPVEKQMKVKVEFCLAPEES